MFQTNPIVTICFVIQVPLDFRLSNPSSANVGCEPTSQADLWALHIQGRPQQTLLQFWTQTQVPLLSRRTEPSRRQANLPLKKMKKGLGG